MKKNLRVDPATFKQAAREMFKKQTGHMPEEVGYCHMAVIDGAVRFFKNENDYLTVMMEKQKMNNDISWYPFIILLTIALAMGVIYYILNGEYIVATLWGICACLFGILLALKAYFDAKRRKRMEKIYKSEDVISFDIKLKTLK